MRNEPETGTVKVFSRPRLEGESCREYLQYMQQWTATEQQNQRMWIIASFKEFWDSRPTEEEFSHHMTRMVLFAEMLYYMVDPRFYPKPYKE